MANKSGWLSSVGLLASRLAGLGNDVHRALAGEFPEAEIDRIRDQLETEFVDISQKLATAKQDAARELDDVTRLKAQIAQEKVAANLAMKEGNEKAATKLITNCESMMAQLDVEQAEYDTAAEVVSEIEKAFTSISEQRNGFEAKAKKALQDRTLAQAKLTVAEQREGRISEARKVGGNVVDTGVAFDALSRSTAKVQAKAEAAKLRAGAGPEAADSDVEKFRKEAAGVVPSASLADRLAALNDEKKAA